jgi:hypothetical protein
MGIVENCQFSCLQWEAFQVSFPEPFHGDDFRVAITASIFGESLGDLRPSLGIAQKVSSKGFTLAERNPCCAGCSLDFDWMAVAEGQKPGQKSGESADLNLRLGVLQPRRFQPDCTQGEWQFWNGIRFSSPLDDGSPVVMLTPSDTEVGGRNAGRIGTVHMPEAYGFNLAAHNSGCQEGDCAFYYVAGSKIRKHQPRSEKNCLWVNSGDVEAVDLMPDCEESGERSMGMTFHRPFSMPPAVLVATNDRGVRGHNAAALGIAQKVTTKGFTLLARNTESVHVQAGFYWIAIGCARGFK